MTRTRSNSRRKKIRPFISNESNFEQSQDTCRYVKEKPKRNDRFSDFDESLMPLASSRLQPVKTYHEVNSSEELVDAYVVELPVKLANRATSLFKPYLTVDNPRSLNHLRRLVNLPHLPELFLQKNNIRPPIRPTIFFVLPASSNLSEDCIQTILRPHIQAVDPDFIGDARVHLTLVPAYPPIAAEKARLWSELYWPCTFNPASQVIQNAPPLASLRKVQDELDNIHLLRYVTLANRVADDSARAGIGRAIGAVVVDPVRNEVLAAAGDARWWVPDKQGASENRRRGEGRPEHHALMRAIAMVAAKEMRRRVDAGLLPPPRERRTDLEGRPLSRLETQYFLPPEVDVIQDEHQDPKVQTSSRSDGYLCNGLDVYLTHETCVCCSMAMVHSRFRSCIFEQRMPMTGGLCAETEYGGLGYGLFWRKELNWRVMTFQHQTQALQDTPAKRPMHVFHA